MNILIFSVGTRGDMEPFLAIAELLKNNGHQVTCAFPEQFRTLATDSGFDFCSLGSNFIELLESDTGKIAMGGEYSGIKKLLAYIKLGKESQSVNKILVQQQKEIVAQIKPDKIIHNAKSLYPVIWEILDQGKRIVLSPIPYLHYVKGHSHIGFNANFGTFLNKLTYKIADMGLALTIQKMAHILIPSQKISYATIRQTLSSTKTIYTISPRLFPRPNDWPSHLQVLGYHERDKTVQWTPDPSLLSFLSQHDKILFVTFGSMTNPMPQEKTKMILDTLKKHNIPAIINTGAGGLEEPETYDHDLYYFVSRIPYEYIFPKMYAVMHHGGSGTTHMTLKYGCPSLVIPHIIDQFAWNTLIHDIGAGPLGISIAKLTKPALESKLIDLWETAAYKEKAQKISKDMSREHFEEEILRTILEE